MKLFLNFIICDIGLMIDELVVIGGDGEVGVDAV